MENGELPWVVGGRGESEAGLAMIRRARKDAEALENRIFVPMTMCFEAHALLTMSATDEAITRLREALDLIAATEEQWWEAEVKRALGRVLAFCGASRVECLAQVNEAIEIASRQRAKLLEGRSIENLHGLSSRENAG